MKQGSKIILEKRFRDFVERYREPFRPTMDTSTMTFGIEQEAIGTMSMPRKYVWHPRFYDEFSRADRRALARLGLITEAGDKITFNI